MRFWRSLISCFTGPADCQDFSAEIKKKIILSQKESETKSFVFVAKLTKSHDTAQWEAQQLTAEHIDGMAETPVHMSGRRSKQIRKKSDEWKNKQSLMLRSGGNEAVIGVGAKLI